MAQMSFLYLSDRYASVEAKKNPLYWIDAIVPREEFRPTLERVWRKPDRDRKSPAVQKPMDGVLMFKTLVLSALYNLSSSIRSRISCPSCDFWGSISEAGCPKPRRRAVIVTRWRRQALDYLLMWGKTGSGVKNDWPETQIMRCIMDTDPELGSAS